MIAYRQYRKVVRIIPEAYFLYKGFYQNVEVVVEGTICDFDNSMTRLFVRLYVDGKQISWVGRDPVRTILTARNRGLAYADDLALLAASGRAQGWPERCPAEEHVKSFRRAPRDLDIAA